MNNRKVAFISSDNYIASGAFLCMVKLCKRLKENGKYTPYVVLPCDGNGKDLLESIGINYKIIKSYNWVIPIHQDGVKLFIKNTIKKIINIAARLRLIIYLKKENIEIIHINTSHTYYALGAAKLLGIKCVWHVREFLEEDQNSKIWNKNGRKIIANADVVIAISEAIKKKVLLTCPSYKVRLVYDGLDYSEYWCSLEEKPYNSKIEILSVGNMGDTKGQDTIIDACYKLVKKGETSFHISFIGEGKNRELYEHRVKEYGLKKNISFYGVKKDVRDFYKKADIFIMSSRSEAFGRTTVEAMLSGCFVVGTNAGATPELLNHGQYGILYERNKPDDLAEILLRLINDRETLKKNLKQTQLYAKNYFSEECNFKSIQDIYDSIFS